MEGDVARTVLALVWMCGIDVHQYWENRKSAKDLFSRAIRR